MKAQITVLWLRNSKRILLQNTVVEDENGYKNIQTDKLAATDAAVLSDVCKRLLAIEEKLGINKE